MDATSEHSFGIFYRTRVRDVMRGTVVTCGVEMPARDMAQLMKEHKLGSCVVVAGSRPLGIVTERDLVYKVVAAGDGQALAGDIMSSPPVTVGPDDHLYEAVYLMMKHRCRRLIVVDAQGDLAGFISMRDLLSLQGYEAGIIGERIAKARDVEALSELRPQIDEFIHKLFLNEVDGRSLAEILTEFNDAIVRRILYLNVQRLRIAGESLPATGWAWVSFGSEGRKEQVLRGDQDNGLILSEAQGGVATRDYFHRLAGGVNEDLATYGFDLCQGGVMAREDKFFGTLPEWQARVHALIHSVEKGQELRDLTIFLDLRHIEGDPGLAQSLWDYMLAEIQRYPPALRALADDAVTKPVPLTFLGRLQYQKDREGKRGINVKKFGMLPLVAGVKAMAMEREVRATSTAERISTLEAMGVLEHHSASQLLFAHQLFLKLKLESSLQKVLHNRQTGHFFYPEEWTEWERQDLKRAFRAVDHLHNLLKAHFVL